LTGVFMHFITGADSFLRALRSEENKLNKKTTALSFISCGAVKIAFSPRVWYD